MSQPIENQSGSSDEAIARRLARLNTLPVDSSRLDALLRQQIPNDATGPSKRSFWLLRPVNAIAASLIGAILIGVLIVSLIDRPAVAAPSQIAQWHAQMNTTTPTGSVMPATTVEAANQMIAQSDPAAPSMPSMPGMDGRMACCSVRKMGESRISCVMIQRETGRVMVCIGDAAKIKIPSTGSTVTQGGVTYHLMSENGVNIVMSHRDGRWIACSGKLPHAELIETAAGLKF